MLPLKTTFDDIEALSNYLKSQVGWVEIEKVKKTINPTYADNRKLESMRYIGLLERDGTNIKLTDLGRKYAGSSDEAVRAAALREHLPSTPLYQSTLEWIHYQKNSAPTRTEIANYWHDKQSALIEGATGAALTDGAIFFIRVAAAAGLGQYIGAGNNRPETYLKVEEHALEKFVTGQTDNPAEPTGEQPPSEVVEQQPPTSQTPPASPTVTVTASPGVHINIEIHVAADAKPSTVEEIFKNMRKYVLDSPDEGNAT